MLVIVIVKAFGLDKKEQFLNYLAQYYFDETYYLQKYPDVKNLDISPFEHYVQIGWKENKNPNTYFDNKLYRNLYLIYDIKGSLILEGTNNNSNDLTISLKNIYSGIYFVQIKSGTYKETVKFIKK